jgi:AcrR family transcriptional regulator
VDVSVIQNTISKSECRYDTTIAVTPTPTDRRRRRTVAAILDATQRLLAQPGGYRAATIEAIAREADVAVASIYFNFEGGKRDIYLALAERAVTINEQAMATARDAPAPCAIDTLTAMGDAYIAFHREHPLALRLVGLRDVDGPADERLDAVRKDIAKRLKVMVNDLAAVIARTVAEGDLPAGTEPRAAAFFYWGSWNGVLALHARGLLSKRELDATLATGRTLMLGVSGVRSRTAP